MTDASHKPERTTPTEFGKLIRAIFERLYTVDHSPRFQSLLMEIDRRSSEATDPTNSLPL